MTATGTAGVWGFGAQKDMEIAVPSSGPGTWMYHKADNVGFGSNDDQRVMPPEVGGRPVPGGAYKAGINVGGDVVIYPRLENTFGWLLYAMSGKLKQSLPAVNVENAMAKTLVTNAQQIVTPITDPATPSKVVVRIWKGDDYNWKPTIAIVGTDSSDQALNESFDFSTTPAAGQRAVGIDEDATLTGYYEAIVGVEVFKTITNVTIPADANLAGRRNYVSVGYEDAVAYANEFTLDPNNPSLVKWLGFRKYIPPGNDGIALGETYSDCKMINTNIILPNDGLISAQMSALGRIPSFERSPAWGPAATYEGFESIPIGSTLGGYIKIPEFEEAPLPVVRAQVGWANQNLDLRQERVYGTPYLEDVSVVGRQLVIDLTVKYKNPDLIQAMLTGSKTGTLWSSKVFTTRFDVQTISPEVISGSTVPYSLRIEATKIMLSMGRPVQLAGNEILLLNFRGTALDVNGDYMKFTLTNGKTTADYAWPS